MRVVADTATDLAKRYPAQSEYVLRAAVAAGMSLVRYRGEGGADAYLQECYPSDHYSRAILNRTTVAPANTTGAGWSAEIVQNAFRTFLKSLTPLSAAAELIGRGIPAAFPRAGSASYPVRSGEATAAPWVEESEPIPVKSGALATVTIGPPRTLALISVMSREAAKRAGGEAVLEQLLKEDVAAALDAAYFSTTAGSDAAHVGLLNGLTPLVGLPGGDEAAIKSDLSRLAVAVSAAGSGQVVFIGSPSVAAALPILAPEVAARVTLLPSSAVANTRLIAVDPLSLLHATDPQPDISASSEAVLHMSDGPLEIVSDAPVTADPVRSMFQTDCIAVRILAEVAFAKRRSGAVAYINDLSWLPA